MLCDVTHTHMLCWWLSNLITAVNDVFHRKSEDVPVGVSRRCWGFKERRPRSSCNDFPGNPTYIATTDPRSPDGRSTMAIIRQVFLLHRNWSGKKKIVCGDREQILSVEWHCLVPSMGQRNTERHTQRGEEVERQTTAAGAAKAGQRWLLINPWSALTSRADQMTTSSP